MLEQLLTTEQAAAFLGTTRRTLEAWRYVGAGPVFVKLRGGWSAIAPLIWRHS
jgi:hypothetical protein